MKLAANATVLGLPPSVKGSTGSGQSATLPSSGEPTDTAVISGPGSSDQQTKDEYAKTLMANPGFMQGALKGLGNGKTITVSKGNEEIVKITSSGPNILETGVKTIADLATQYSESDPVISVRVGAALMKPVLNNLPVGEGVTAAADKFVMPLVRGLSLALDLSHTVHAFRNNNATPTEKTMEAIHLATDVAGMVGALAIAMPGAFPAAVGKYAELMLGAAIGTDIVTCGYRLTNFARNVSPGGLSNQK